jgi:hypothetical protein
LAVAFDHASSPLRSVRRGSFDIVEERAGVLWINERDQA